MIIGGGLAVGDSLPMVKELSAQYEVSASTVKRAFALLAQWGLIESATGIRPRVLLGND
jgi:DNA-binding GntR family transcriptional regulator